MAHLERIEAIHPGSPGRGDVLFRGSDRRWAVLADPGESGQVLLSGGGSADPSWGPRRAGAELSMPTGALAATSGRSAANTASITLSSGVLRWTVCELGRIAKGQTVNSITFVSGGTAATSPTNQWFVLLDETLTILGKTVDDTTAAWAASSAKTLALSTPYVATRTITPRLGIMVAAVTPPTLVGAAVSSAANGIPPVAAAVYGSGYTTPASLASVGTGTTSGSMPYGYCS